MSRQIPLGRDLVAIVDDADYEWLTQRGPWHSVTKNGRAYAVHTDFTAPSTFTAVRMHKLLLPGAAVVDHINRDSLDNRRSNLRAASTRQNAQNRRRRSDSRWPYKGIRRSKGEARNPWTAGITVDGKARHLGSFPTAEDAARAYDAAALEGFGPFAALNFPQEESA